MAWSWDDLDDSPTPTRARPSHHIISPAPFFNPGAEQPFFSHSRRARLVPPSSPSPSSSNNLQSTNNKHLYVLPPLTPACEWPRTLDPPPFQSAREPRRLLPRQGEATPQTERQRAAHPRWRHRQQGPRWAISCSSSVSAGPSCPQQTIPICHEMSCGFRLWGRERGSWSVLTTGNWPRALLRIKRAQARRALALPPRSISHLLSPTATGDARLIDRTLQISVG